MKGCAALIGVSNADPGIFSLYANFFFRPTKLVLGAAGSSLGLILTERRENGACERDSSQGGREGT